MDYIKHAAVALMLASILVAVMLTGLIRQVEVEHKHNKMWVEQHVNQ